MAQYKAGDTRTIGGVIYSRDASGTWHPSGAASPLTSPTYDLQRPKTIQEMSSTATSTAKTAFELEQARATAQADRIKAENEAKKSGIDVKAAQADLNTKTGTPPGDVSKTGDAYVASLPPGVAELTKEMLAGKYKGSITSSRNPVVMQAALAAAHATNGNFDAGKYDERLAFMKSVTDPNSQLGALNTALAHAGVMHDQAQNVAGADTFGHTPFSTAENALSNWWNSGSPAVTQYKGTLQKYGSEAAKAYGINTGGERQTIEEPYNINLPLDAKNAALANDVKLYMGKIGSMAHGYDMIGGNNPLDYFSPEALAAIKKLAPDEYQKLATAGQAHGVANGSIIPPTGPTDGTLGPSTDGFSNTPDPQSAAFWDNAIRNHVPYREALTQWKQQLGDKTVVTPPDPKAYTDAVTFSLKHPNVEYNPVESVFRKPLSPGEQMMNGAAQSPAATFGVNYYNDLGAGIPLALMGDRGARYQAISGALNPKAAELGNVLGTVGGVVGASKGLDAAIEAGKELPLLKPYMKGIGLVGDDATQVALRRGLTADNLYGATSGAAQSPDNPTLGAAEGMGAMTAGNAAGRYLLGPAIRGAQKGINKVGGMFGAQPFNIPAPLDSAQKSIFGQANPALDSVRNKLTQAADLGIPYALGDADPRLQALTGSAVRKSPDVFGLANQTLVPRQLGQAERAINLIDTHLAPTGDISAIKNAQIEQARAAAKPMYEQAYQAPARTNGALQSLLQTPAGKQALVRARTIAANEQRDPNALGFDLNDQGEVTLAKNPSAQTLDYVKRGLDDLLEPYRNQMTGQLQLDEAGRAINGVRAKLLTQLDKLYPDYAAARSNYAALASTATDAQRGYDATSPKVSPETVATAMGSLRDGNAPFFRQGYASSMADAANNAQLSGNPYNRVYGTPNQQAKVNMIFPGAPKFGNAYNLENDMSGTAREALGGSPTATRMEADKHFAEGNLLGTGADLAMSAAMGVPPVFALRRGAAFAARDMFRLGVGNAAKNKADAIGPILLNTDPAAGLQTLDDLQRLAALRQAYVNRTGAMGGMFAAPVIYGASQR